jgi:hypothetical protein
LLVVVMVLVVVMTVMVVVVAYVNVALVVITVCVWWWPCAQSHFDPQAQVVLTPKETVDLFIRFTRCT